jgi:16S rRNA G527 N7-methylase RsmG
LDLVVKYQTADVSNTGQAFQDNMAVMKALVQKFPELREAFDGVVARAVESSGRDYGTMMPMKEIK